MIKKLRRKFIWIAMLSMLFVLGTIMVVINVINYSKTDEYSDRVIDILIENEGGFPTNFPMRPGIGDHGMTPETPFESRYFTVLLDEHGEVINVNINRIASITQESAKEFATNAYHNKKNSGMQKDFKFQSKQTDDGLLYVFLDCTREMNSFRGFLQTSGLISLGGLAVVFILIIIFSRIALKPVEESYKKQKHFITNASHDIKTPLTIINAGADVIELEHGESEWTREIKRQTDRLTVLTDKLVFLSKMEEENKQIEIQDINLSEMIAQTIEPYENLAIARGISFTFNCQDVIAYKGNEEMLSQALIQLLDNAFKYTPDDGRILLSLKKSIKGVEISLQNTASEVKIGNNNDLFERFYRRDKSRNSKTGGQGIGLSVVKAIVNAHKGKITAFSQDGKSIDFTIIL